MTEEPQSLPGVELGRVAVVGLGRMGSAITRAVLDSGHGDVVGAEADPDRARAAADELGIPTGTDNGAAVEDADVVLLAVKPQVFTDVLDDVAPRLAAHALVVSIAAGVRIDTIQAAVGERPVVRIMPNTPLLVGQGMSVLAPGPTAGDDDLARAAALVGPAGDVRVITEDLFDAVTAVSGSGPAYVFALAEAMIAGAVEQGLEQDDAVALVEQTVAGAGALLRASELGAEELRIMVSSPGGTTLAGLAAMDQLGFGDAVRRGVDAATRRGRELAGGD